MGGSMEDIIPMRANGILPVVGLGGSAGSIEALRNFFETMPADSGMAFVVVLHLSPEHESSLAALLQRVTPMPVVQATDALKVEANCVYVIPPAKQLSMVDGHLRLFDLHNDHGKRVVVDLLFRTLADTHGPNALGVVLSGLDGDGSIGLKRIKERGGLTVAQDPSEAEHEGMPRSAIATGMVDWVLPVAEMPARLIQYERNARRLRLPDENEPPRPSSASPAARTELREILALLRTRTGRDFSYYKRATILRRIGRRMQVNGIEELPDYLDFLRTHPGEAGALLQDLLISVTNFFRDREAFEMLEAEIPRLFARKKTGDQVRVWAPGCATGEEAYSVAMLLAEHAATLDAPPSIQVFATDIDENAIHSAREGRYPHAIAADVSQERLRRFFAKEHGGCRIRREVRETVLFAVHDLLKDSPFSRLDLITCRNLLIYLNRDAQARALDVFHFALRQEGLLFLGSSESADDARALFDPVNKKYRFYARSNTPRQSIPLAGGASLLVHSLSQPAAVSARAPALPLPPAPGERSALSWSELHYNLLEEMAPPSVVVDADCHIVHVSERAGRYLHFGGGEPTMNLLRLVHPMLRIELRTALFRAAQSGAPAEASGVLVEIEGERRAVNLRVRPAGASMPGVLLVVFQESQSALPDSARPGATEPALRHLEEELEQLKAQQRESLEQYEASTEELKASNEELQSMNEELRSASEELETSREELQAINEELITVNQELRSKAEEVGRANGDLQNLMASTNIATVFLDRELRIKRYTPTAVALFNLIPTDLGRPLSDLRLHLEYEHIAADAGRVLGALLPVEREICGSEGRCYLARLLPYRTVDDRIAGVVLTFVDITERVRAEEAMRLSEERYRALTAATTQGVWRTNGDGKVLLEASGSGFLLHDDGQSQFRDWLGAFVHPEDREQTLAAWERAVVTRSFYDQEHRTRVFGGEYSYVRSRGVPLLDEQGEVREWVGTTTDITGIKQAEDERARLLAAAQTDRQEAEAANAAKDQFLAMLSHELRTPLAPIQMALYAMEHDPQLSDAARQGTALISRNIEVEARLIDDLLDVSRIIHGKLELRRAPLELHDCLADAVEVCREEIRAKEIKLSVAMDALPIRLVGDAARLQQVFWNLLKNAAKFTPAGGEISVRSHLCNLPDGSTCVCVEVADTGIGIKPEVLPKLFDAFEQGSPDVVRRYGGLGLGLAIARAIVQAHGGRLSAASPGEGQGATFSVELPATEPGSGDEPYQTTSV